MKEERERERFNIYTLHMTSKIADKFTAVCLGAVCLGSGWVFSIFPINVNHITQVKLAETLIKLITQVTHVIWPIAISHYRFYDSMF